MSVLEAGNHGQSARNDVRKHDPGIDAPCFHRVLYLVLTMTRTGEVNEQGGPRETTYVFGDGNRSQPIEVEFGQSVTIQGGTFDVDVC